MKTKVAVAMGGYSSEFEISLKSGETVCRNLPEDKYEVFPIVISRDAWYYRSPEGGKIPVDRADFSIERNGEKVRFDVVFNAIHGHPGEDGVLPAYWEMCGLPHTSADFDKMALTFNKMYTLAAVRSYGIPTARSVYLQQNDAVDVDAIVRETGLPLFVKPNRAGSSYGISKVKSKEELMPAIALAFKEDKEVLIEEFLEGREFSVGVIKLNGKAEVFPVTEIIPENEFFDYEAKYLGKALEITPADLDDATRRKIVETAKKVYEVLDLDGVSRAEYILRDGVPYFLEINMVPGLTEASILPQQIRAAGKSLGAVFDEIVENALKKFKRK
jgi:D-alanine-D-alanine ligase